MKKALIYTELLTYMGIAVYGFIGSTVISILMVAVYALIFMM